MPKSATLWLALSLTICAGCSKTNSPSAPPPSPYAGIPAGLMERCTVQDIPLITASTPSGLTLLAASCRK